MLAPRFPLDEVVYPQTDKVAEYVARGSWAGDTIPQLLAQRAESIGSRPAYICEDREWTFAQIRKASLSVSRALVSAGLRPGDRALFQMGTIAETQVALLGCMNVGVLPVCTIPQYRELEIGAIAELTRPKAYFVQADFTESMDLAVFARAMCRKLGIDLLVVARAAAEPGELRLEDLVDAPEQDFDTTAFAPGVGDVAVLQLSGGSTGLPKIIPRFHGEYLAHTKGWLDSYDSSEADVRIWSLPLLHNAGMMFTLLGSLLYGTTTVLQPRWKVDAYFSLIERHGVTQAFTIGPHAPIIAAYEGMKGHDLSSLRCFLTLIGAEGIEAATGVTAINMFGITEGLVLTSSPDDPVSLRHRTIGSTCTPFDEVRLLELDSEVEVPLGEVGELCFRSPSSLTEYYRAADVNAASFTSNGFFRTGDLVRSVPSGDRVAYRFEGRIKDNINRGGEKFGTEELEGLLCAHPAISDAKVVAMPHPVYGEKACAFLVLRPGAELPSLRELQHFLTGRGLAKFKVPERLETIDAFPTTRVGKLDRARLRQMIAEKVSMEKVACE